MVGIRQILREDYPCETCGSKRGDYCHTLRGLRRGLNTETDPHESRWEQYRSDRRRRFASDISPERRRRFREAELQIRALGDLPPVGSIPLIPKPPVITDGIVPVEPFEPRRDDDVARWLRRSRDRYEKGEAAWDLLDFLLDDYRLHADTGTSLEFDVHEADLGG